MTNFLMQSYLSYRGLFLWLTPWAYLSNVLVAPIVNVVLFGLVNTFAAGDVAHDWLLVGICAVSTSTILLGGILQAFYYERQFTTLSVIFGSPVNRIIAYWSKGLAHYPNSILSALGTFAFAILVLDLDASTLRVSGAVLSILMIGTATLAFAQFFGNCTAIFENWFVLFGLTNSAMLALTGAVIPRDALPFCLQQVGTVLPITHGLSALRASFAGAPLAMVIDNVLAELLVALGFGIAGTIFYRLMEVMARRRGMIAF